MHSIVPHHARPLLSILPAVPAVGVGVGAGGAGWGGWGGETDPNNQPQPYDPWTPAQCNAYAQQMAQAGCNVRTLPVLTTNGRGSGGGDFVPDFLVRPFSPAVALGFGGIFKEACNTHDRCYGSTWSTKDQCDSALEYNMVVDAQRNIPSALHPLFAFATTGQAHAYRLTLQWEQYFPWNTSKNVCNSAQSDAQCRDSAADFRAYGCQ